ncbi:DUF3846 domain-containing protein [Blastochloris tepida]|uniref:DUF3846 domain-containing protein n=1 Tax=Blastochloris tepida TaxID=2233851 RepID=A0A348FZC9_9HYPH|nr:hypothetical protein [Blastochloris tepida]BBF92662.1 hypothetical protein BLTE_13470 [Blastochloris tepida]
MRAYLIDPKTFTISEVEHDGSVEDIYRLIKADRFDAARFNDTGDAVFIDDDGLGKGPRWDFFQISGFPHPLAGRGLVLGCDENGDSTTPTVTREWLLEHVAFLVCVEPGVFAVIRPMPCCEVRL